MKVMKNTNKKQNIKWGRVAILVFGALLILTGLVMGLRLLFGGSSQPSETQTAKPQAQQETTETQQKETSSEKPTQSQSQSQEEDKKEDKKKKDDTVDKMLETMTLEEKVAQMIVVSPEQIAFSEGYITEYDENVESAIQSYPVGGVILFSDNCIDMEQVNSLLTNMYSYNSEVNKVPLLLAVDEEGGEVSRLIQTGSMTEFNPMYDYRDEGEATAKSNASTIASDLKKFGFNTDFAPVADTWSNPENTVIGNRAYSDDYNQAAVLVKAAVKGFKEQDIICTLKHFPGHGDTAEDSHYGPAYSYKTLEELQAGEFLPFIAGIEGGADMVMTGHIILPELDENYPASLSPTVINILRNDLKFDGVIITDDLCMDAINTVYTVEEAAVQAVLAGNDMLLRPADVDAAMSAILAAVEDGTITEEQIDQSVRRILTMKHEHQMF